MVPIRSKPLAPQRNPNQENSSMKSYELYAIGNALMDKPKIGVARKTCIRSARI